LDIRANLREGRLVPVLPDWRGQRYLLHAILPSNRFIPARVRALVDHLAACFAQLAAEEGGLP
jgi:DNA-binding transcriptional LysR family regulator